MELERIPAPPSDPSTHTAAFKIFHYNYKCSIQRIHMYSEKVLEERGFQSSGFREIDRTSMNAFVPCHLTIAAMAEYADEGVPIRLANPNDAVTISQIIQTHLADCLRGANYDINMIKTPVEDLRKLDALAEKVHPISVGMLKNRSPQENEFFRRLREWGGRGMLSKLRKPEEETSQRPTSTEGYKSMIPALTEAIGTRNKPWLKGQS